MKKRAYPFILLGCLLAMPLIFCLAQAASEFGIDRRGPCRPWREFSFALHQIQQAIEPQLSLQQTPIRGIISLELSRGSRANDSFSRQDGMPCESHGSITF
jgi:hypothetical protein